MALTDDIRSASENAVESIVTRFADLPKPIAAVVGAGEMAAERLSALRTQITERFEDRAAIVNIPAVNPADLAGDLRSAAGDLPGKVQQLAGELPGKVGQAATGVAHQVQEFAAAVPGKVSQLVEEIPGKATELAEFAGQLRPDTIRQTAEAYAGVVGSVYDNLADHGQEVWDKVRESVAPDSTKVVDAAKVATPAAAPRRTRTAAPKPATKATSSAARKPRAKAATPAATTTRRKAPAARKKD